MNQRDEQKARTREALLEAARTILGRGETLTVTKAAAESGISKASAYRYFSDLALLAAEAGLHVKMAPYEEIVAGASTTRSRLTAICIYYFDVALENEAAFRTYLSLNLRTASTGGPRRGARRITAFRRALEDAVPDAQARKLAAALSAATGIEAIIALMDIGGCSAAEARETVREMAEAICDRMLGLGEQGR